MQRKRKATALVLALMLLAACGGPASSSSITQGGGELPSHSVPKQDMTDVYYDYTCLAFPSPENDASPRYTWGRDGTLTFQNQNTLNLLSPQNELLETVTIPEEHLIGGTPYQFSWGDAYVLAVAARFSRPGVVYFTDDGGVHLANVTLFDRQGELVRQYHAGPVYEDDTNAFLLPVPQGTEMVGCGELYNGGDPPVYWLDGETAVFNCHSRIVLYDFAADTGRVLDDMTALVEKYGKFGVYYGADSTQCGVMDGSFYYLTHREDAKDTVWRADKDGAREQFGGDYWHFFAGSRALMLAEYIDSANPESADRLYHAAPRTDQPREVLQGSLSIPLRENGQYLAFRNRFGREDSVLYAYNCDTGELSRHSLGEIVQVNDLWVRPVDGSLRYYYTTFVNGTEADWVYDTATDATTRLPDGTVGSILSVSPDGSRVLRRNKDGSARLQVGLWEP